MTDLTEAELDEFEAMIGYWELGDGPSVESLEALIAEVRRWRDQAADEAGLARLEDAHWALGIVARGMVRDMPETVAVRPQDGAHAPKEERSE